MTGPQPGEYINAQRAARWPAIARVGRSFNAAARRPMRSRQPL